MPLMCTGFMRATAKAKLHDVRCPVRMLIYQAVAQHPETWLDLISTG